MSRPPRPPDGPAEPGLFAATLLHELRQPLFAVRGRLQLARANGRPPTLEEIDELLGLLDHAQELLDQHQGAPSPPPAPQDLRVCVTEVLAMVGGGRSRCVRSELPARPVAVRGRAVALRQVVSNLLHNALEAVAERPAPEVIVRVSSLEGRARLEIEDNGPGVPEALGERVFDPYVTGRPGRGTGLGLFVARRLAEEARGRLELRARPGGGTVARVDLPLDDGTG